MTNTQKQLLKTNDTEVTLCKYTKTQIQQLCEKYSTTPELLIAALIDALNDGQLGEFDLSFYLDFWKTAAHAPHVSG